jgi:hypothetical protein
MGVARRSLGPDEGEGARSAGVHPLTEARTGVSLSSAVGTPLRANDGENEGMMQKRFLHNC